MEIKTYFGGRDSLGNDSGCYQCLVPTCLGKDSSEMGKMELEVSTLCLLLKLSMQDCP